MNFLTVEVLISTISFLIMAVVYLYWHEYRMNIFTRLLATLTASFALIMAYVGYNVLAIDFHWSVLSGTWVAYTIYGLLACVGSFGAFVFVKETRREIKRRRK